MGKKKIFKTLTFGGMGKGRRLKQRGILKKGDDVEGTQEALSKKRGGRGEGRS